MQRLGVDQRRASFDKLRMRVFLGATKTSPHPELVEGRTVVMPANGRSTEKMRRE